VGGFWAILGVDVFFFANLTTLGLMILNLTSWWILFPNVFFGVKVP